jgi:TetR/AcrR family transcriptional repressor of nem operon
VIRQGSLRPVSRPENALPGRRLTPRGAATRARIVAAAVELMYVKGVNATTLDDVRAASNTSKSQLYNHFPDKEELVRAVVAARAAQVLERERGHLQRLKSFRGLVRWRDALVQRNALRNGAYGCALGSLASEVSDHDALARQALSHLFTEWQGLLAGVLRRLQDNGALAPEAPVDQLATGLMAALQGGYMLAQTARDVTPMATSIDMALAHIESLSAS